MARFRAQAQSPALWIALVALFVALGGTGYAALNIANNSIGTKQLKRGAVKNPDLAANSVTGAKVKRRSLDRSDFKANSLPSGPQGQQGPVGPTGATGSPAFGAVLGRGEAVPAGTSFLAPSGQLAASGTENGGPRSRRTRRSPPATWRSRFSSPPTRGPRARSRCAWATRTPR
jgi:hypothetical protein